MESSLEGKLKSFKVPDILTFLNLSRKTGCLSLSHDSSSANIHLESGSIVFASSNQKKMRLGRLLLKRKRIEPEQANQIEAIMLEQGEKFGRVAVEEKILSEQELRDYLKIQVSEILYDSFNWEEGAFHFQDTVSLPEHAVTISVDLTNLIMEGARRIDEWDRCRQLLPDEKAVFRVVSVPEIQEKITLTLDEWKILFLIDGQRSLGSICEQSEEESLEVYRVVYGLYANKLIEPVTKLESVAEALARMEIEANETIPPGEVTTNAQQDDTGLLVSPEARLTYRDVVRVIMARLTVKDSERTYPLVDHEYVIGRSATNSICLNDPSISAIHARLYRGPDGYILEDLHSRNGTYINDERVDRQVLKENDCIRIGTSELIYHIVYDVK